MKKWGVIKLNWKIWDVPVDFDTKYSDWELIE